MRFQRQGSLATVDLHGVYERDARDLLAGWLNTAPAEGDCAAGYAARRLFPSAGPGRSSQPESGGDAADLEKALGKREVAAL